MAFPANELAGRVGLGHRMAMAAHPTLTARGHTQHQPIVGHVTDYYRPGADKSVPSDGGSANDGRVGADRGPAADQSPFVKMVPQDLRAGIVDVGEHARRSAEDIVFQDGAGVDRY